MIAHDTTTPDVDTASEDYARRFAGEVGQYLLEAQDEAFVRLCDPSRRGALKVLEVGGGHAQLTPLLLACGFEVWVQGSAPSCARRLAPLVARHPGRLHFVTSDLWSLPFPDETFDLVLAIRLMAHVERWQALLTEMGRVSKGGIVIDYPPIVGINFFEPLLFNLKRRIEKNTRPFFCYNAGAITRALRGLRFDRFAVRKQFFMPMVVHRAMKRPALSRAIESICRWLGLTHLLGGPVLLLAERASAAGAGE